MTRRKMERHNTCSDCRVAALLAMMVAWNDGLVVQINFATFVCRRALSSGVSMKDKKQS